MLENIFKKAKNVTDIAYNKVEEFTSISNLKIRKIKLNQKISDSYKHLGKAVFTSHKEKIQGDQKLDGIIQDIEKLLAELKDINRNIDNIKASENTNINSKTNTNEGDDTDLDS